MAQNEKKTARYKQKEQSQSKQTKTKRKQYKRVSPKSRSHKKSLFGSERFHSNHNKKQSNVKGIASSNKVITTDESNNCYESKIHQSIFYCENKEPNEQYFHSIAAKTNRNEHSNSKNTSKKKNQSKNTFNQVKKLIVSQDRQIARMKGTLSEKQLHRLLKMQSIERLKAIQSLNNNIPSKRKLKN